MSATRHPTGWPRAADQRRLRHAHLVATLPAAHAVSGQCLRGLFAQHGLRGVRGVHVNAFAAFRTGSETSGLGRQSIHGETAHTGLFASANVVVISGSEA